MPTRAIFTNWTADTIADKFYDYVTTVDKIPYATYIHGHLAPMTRTEVSALRKEIGETDL